MLKFAIATILLGSSLSCVAEDHFNPFEALEEDGAHSIYESIGLASVCLIEGDYHGALDNYFIASLMAEDAVPSVPGAKFLIHFGKAIAFDNLGMRDQCMQAIGTMFVSLVADNDDLEEEDGEDEPDTPEEIEAYEFMKNLATLAPSQDVREFLVSFLKELLD